MVHGPSNDHGALDAFVSIITGPPGPRPEQLVPAIPSPILLLWGDKVGADGDDGAGGACLWGNRGGGTCRYEPVKVGHFTVLGA